MATLRCARLTAHRVACPFKRHGLRRAFGSSGRDDGAHNLPMPALSPTMTEGNISRWQVKEGDSYSAGDVLLEIETDKATMDVEAQDDGIIMKVVKGDGSKGVKVGQRIAVFADPGDDVSQLEIPPDDSAQASKPTKDAEPKKARSEPSAKPESKAEGISKPTTQSKDKPAPGSYRRPLYPSVEHLLNVNGLSEADAEGMKATGPGGRLLKGDVLAHIGKIEQSKPTESAIRLEKLSHLDLSNIKRAPPKQTKPAESKLPESKQEPPKIMNFAIPISFTAVAQTQKRVKDTLGITLPLSVFVARATELANEDLPRSRHSPPTADELFDSVIGLDKLPKPTQGHFMPVVTAPIPASKAPPGKKVDIIDILTSAPKQQHKPQPALVTSPDENVFSVSAPAADKHSARVFLERLKLTLEQEPGRLII